jgi:quercetin dioxygenase-like cupin family protein
MAIMVKRLVEFAAEDVKGHLDFKSRTILKLDQKGLTVRVLTLSPGGIGPVPAHRHSDVHFFLVLEGVLDLEIEGQTYKIFSGSCIEVDPGKIHQLRCAEPRETIVLAIKWV